MREKIQAYSPEGVVSRINSLKGLWLGIRRSKSSTNWGIRFFGGIGMVLSRTKLIVRDKIAAVEGLNAEVVGEAMVGKKEAKKSREKIFQWAGPPGPQ